MIYTNKHGLPPLLAKVLVKDEYELTADFSATGLVSPPQIRVLQDRHKSKIMVDVAEEIWRLMGQAMHYVVSQTPGSNLLAERKLLITLDGFSVQMTPDLYIIDTNHLWDYKFTSVWSAIFGVKPDWEAQANIYKYGLWHHGYPVDRADILAILRDWIVTKARFEQLRGNGDYPPVQVKVMPVKLWKLEDIEKYIRERIVLHVAASKTRSDEMLAEMFPCSFEERWAKKSTYPVIRKQKGGERAASGTAKLETREEAEAWLAEKGKPGDRIVERQGEQTRCEYYCPVKPFCQQYKELTNADL